MVILTHLSVKEDSHTLYGFASEAERTLFRQLLKISGIGAKLALTILSGASGDELARYVVERDAAALTRLPGIGKKTAERIIIELRDKLDSLPAGAGSRRRGRPGAGRDAARRGDQCPDRPGLQTAGGRAHGAAASHSRR